MADLQQRFILITHIQHIHRPFGQHIHHGNLIGTLTVDIQRSLQPGNDLLVCKLHVVDKHVVRLNRLYLIQPLEWNGNDVAAGCNQNGIGFESQNLLRRDLLPQLHRDIQLLCRGLIIVDSPLKFALEGGLLCNMEVTADLIAFVEHHHVKAALFERDRSFHARGACAHDGDDAPGTVYHERALGAFAQGKGVHGAVRLLIAERIDIEAIHAGDAVAKLILAAFGTLLYPFALSQNAAAHTDHVALAVIVGVYVIGAFQRRIALVAVATTGTETAFLTMVAAGTFQPSARWTSPDMMSSWW